MILFLHRIAKRIYFLRPFFLLLAGLLAAAFIYVVIANNPKSDIYLLVTGALLGWCFCLYGIASGFVQLPTAIAKKDGWFTRFKKRFKLFFAWLFACVFIICSLGMVYITYIALSFAITGR